MNALVILTSALNTRFGVFTPEQRMAQTLESINSIKRHAPGAKIAVVEMAGVSPTAEQLQTLYANVDYVLDYSKDEGVLGLYNSTDNWDIVKNTTEVMIFANALQTLIDQGEIAKFDRVFKMSGRYTLNDNFNFAYYDTVPDRIVVAERRASQFPPQVTGGMVHQYMSRLWSWPANRTADIISAYQTGFGDMAVRINEGGYFDIEHLLYAYLPKDLVTEVPKVGISGAIGPNGAAIED